MTKPTRATLHERSVPTDHDAEWRRHAAGMPSWRGKPLATLRRVG